MWGKRNESKSGTIDTLIGPNTELRGDVVFSGGLHVEGTIKGNVRAEEGSGSVLSVSEKGLIEGEVRVPKIRLNGSVVGDVHATEHVELAPHARVKGDVYYKVIEMARGAEVNGSLVSSIDGAPANARKKGPKPVVSTVAVDDNS